MSAPAALSGTDTTAKGSIVTDTLSIAADLLTLIGTTLTITLELRRARNEDQPDEQEEDQHK
ncbi:hypothetical protein ABZ371_00030 [Streptomyces sp. NPDC005899]|uniref:hypothetical protein n=1 Tax=Streptomyces sp. NPDC005899 TaxID=3155716 RepID=UPI0033EE2F18